MKITDIKIRRLYDRDKMKAVCSVTFDGELVVHDIKVIENDGKTFIAMPSRRSKEGFFSDIVHPITQPLTKVIKTAAPPCPMRLSELFDLISNKICGEKENNTKRDVDPLK